MNKINCYRNQCNEVCRMPWFLVEVKTKGRKTFQHFIVHSVDIKESQSTNMYVNGLVQFDHNQSLVEGNVLLASEDRSFVEQEMQRLTLKAESDKMKGRLFFIQYSVNSREIVHKVVAETDIDWPANSQQTPGEVFIKVGDRQCRATVLMIGEQENQIETEFEKLKTWCLLKCFDRSCSNRTIDAAATDNWMLVQYCKASFEVVYAILNERETHWTEENLYKNVVIYTSIGETIFQALVLSKSRSLESLMAQINNIRESAALSSLAQMETSKNNNFKHPSASSYYQEKIVST